MVTWFGFRIFYSVCASTSRYQFEYEIVLGVESIRISLHILCDVQFK